MVVFCPYGSAASYTDPSYHLPAFYEVFARESESSKDKKIWREVAQTSREFFKSCTDSTTGLAPDYASFDGAGYGSKNYYSFDAWRVPMNIAMDYAWWKEDEWQNEYANRIQSFFHSEGMGIYYDNYDLNGTPKYNADHSIGAVGCNAVASLAADTSISWEFVKELWDSPIPEGKWRYYNGLLYMLSLLNVSGNYRVYMSENASLDQSESNTENPTTTSEPGDTDNYDTPDGEWTEILNHKDVLESNKDMYTKYTSNSNISYNKYGPSSTKCMQITGGGSSSPSGIKIDVSDLVSAGDWVKAEFKIQVTGVPDTIQSFVTDNTNKDILSYSGNSEFKTGQWIDYTTDAVQITSENDNLYFCVSNASGYWYIADVVLYKLNESDVDPTDTPTDTPPTETASATAEPSISTEIPPTETASATTEPSISTEIPPTETASATAEPSISTEIPPTETASATAEPDTPTITPTQEVPTSTPKNEEIRYLGMTKQTEQNRINFTVKISNTYDEDKTVQRIIACYKNGVLKYIQIYDDVLKANDTTDISDFVINDNYDSIKVFYYNDLTNIQPLFNCIHIK
jgi:hypothetical protein